MSERSRYPQQHDQFSDSWPLIPAERLDPNPEQPLAEGDAESAELQGEHPQPNEVSREWSDLRRRATSIDSDPDKPRI